MPSELLEADRVHSIVGAFFTIYNYYGYGLSESIYAGALECELTHRGHRVARELAVAVSYKGRHVAWQRLDMVVDHAVIVENKATEKLSPAARPQLISYLRATPFQVGVLLHFGRYPTFYRFIDFPKRSGAPIRIHSSDSCPSQSSPASTEWRLSDKSTESGNAANCDTSPTSEQGHLRF
jgi:GxxExxY protein